MKKFMLVMVMAAFMTPAVFAADKKNLGPQSVECDQIAQAAKERKALVGQADEEKADKKGAKAQ